MLRVIKKQYSNSKKIKNQKKLNKMKKVKKTFVRTTYMLSLMVVATAMIAFVGCSKGGDDPVPPPGEPSELEVDPVTSYFTYPADTVDIDVFATDPWTATVSSGATWCTVTPASGNGDGYISIAVTPNTNPTGGERAATVTLASGDVTATVTVTQEILQTTPCTKCLWNGSAWVDGYVTNDDFIPTDADNFGWSGNGAAYYSATSDKDGRANTAKITDAKDGSAVKHCTDLGTGWYLPAYEELFNIGAGTPAWGGLMGSPLNGLAGANLLTSPDDFYLTSTEFQGQTGRYNGPVAVPGEDDQMVIKVSKNGETLNAYKQNQPTRCVWRP
jgi:hypothetical protein